MVLTNKSWIYNMNKKIILSLVMLSFISAGYSAEKEVYNFCGYKDAPADPQSSSQF